MEALASFFIAIIAGGTIFGIATVSGNQQALCERMGGKYTPAAAPGEICPGGKWSALVGITTPPSTTKK